MADNRDAPTCREMWRLDTDQVSQGQTVTAAPSGGEQAALRGYKWQYDHIAVMVYDSLIEDDFVALNLADPEAGQVDDLVLVRRGRTDAFQFKSSGHDGTASFRDLLRPRQTSGGNPAPSLIKSLAQGWQALKLRFDNPNVHLTMQLRASVNDHVTGQHSQLRPSPDHLSAFIARVMNPLRIGSLTLAKIPVEWSEPVALLHAETGLPWTEFEEFVRAFYLDLGTRDPLPSTHSTRRRDILTLSDALVREVSAVSGVVRFDRRSILELVGWTGRPVLRSVHEFPVDLDTYSPLHAAISELRGCLDLRTQGYIAVVGPPGAGKSTLLSQTLAESTDRVVRYFSYVPGTPAGRTRLSGTAFLHDIVVMLGHSGLGSRQRQLAGQNPDELRRQLHDQLDAASEEFHATGRRTILVVDGLDHVERDNPGPDGLTLELPPPAELPDGVIVVVGSRTLRPLLAHARHQVEEHSAVIDLEQHRLTPEAVLEVCRRASITALMQHRTHQRIAELSGGHPLALSYVLNRLRDYTDDDPDAFLSDISPYEGDIAGDYRAVWDTIEDNYPVLSILTICSRLRIGFTPEWLETWATPEASHTFRKNFRYLFRLHHDGWHFFHDSFRQFAENRTAMGDSRRPDVTINAAAHAKVAEVCRTTTDTRIAAEEIYHRYKAGDSERVLALGQQDRFRAEFRQLRSPKAISDDIGIVMRTAAQQRDTSALLRMLLALTETMERAQELESIDVAGVLHDAGLVNEAITYCGDENDRRVLLAHAYGLATKLGRSGDAAGRQIFDHIQHNGFDDEHGRIRMSGTDNDAARGWVLAATQFLPQSAIVARISSLLGHKSESDDFDSRRPRNRYFDLMRTLITALGEQGRDGDLQSLDAELIAVEESMDGPSKPAGNSVPDDLARVSQLRVQLLGEIVALTGSSEEAQDALAQLLADLKGRPIFHATALDLAELAATYGTADTALKLISNSPYARTLTVSSLGYNGGDDAIENRFRYLRLRHEIDLRSAGLSVISNSTQVSSRPSKETPAGDDIKPGAPIHSDTAAISLADRIDEAIGVLSQFDAATRAGEHWPEYDAWAALVPILDLFPDASQHRASSSAWGILQNKPAIMRILFDAVLNHGISLADRLSTTLSQRFNYQPTRWSNKLRIQVARQLRSAGVDAPWYLESLKIEERTARDQDLNSRLQDLAELSQIYASDGNFDEAQRIAQSLVSVAFSVGGRKDYQFEAWVAWLGRALTERPKPELIDDAAWLAKMLVAAEPLTDGALGTAANQLPALVAGASPMAAARLFEYFVRNGTVGHIDALADTVTGLLGCSGTDEQAVNIAADLTTDFISAAGNRAYPRLAEAIVSAARQHMKVRASEELVTSVANKIDNYALPTARSSWQESLGLSTGPGNAQADGQDTYSDLVLADGTRIRRAEVESHIKTIQDIVALRRAEGPDSNYSWEPPIKRRPLSASDRWLIETEFGGPSKTDAGVLALLAERALADGKNDEAQRIAEKAIAASTPDSWSNNYGGARRRAYAVSLRLGPPEVKTTAIHDLVSHVLNGRWYTSMLSTDLADIMSTLDADGSWSGTWAEIRDYLRGIADTLSIPDDDVYGNLAHRWWMPDQSANQRTAPMSDSPQDALAELVVGHLSHPTWVVHDAAIRTVIRALQRSNINVAQALARFTTPNLSDDLLEPAARCLAGARLNASYTPPACLEELELQLENHPNLVIGRFAAKQARPSRPLSPLYQLVLPGPPVQTIIGKDAPFLAPHEAEYEDLAEHLGLDESTIRKIAEHYADDSLTSQPGYDELRSALTAARMEHTHPAPVVLASRSAFGRVLGDLADAGLLKGLSNRLRRRLRTIDLRLLTKSPDIRPKTLPSAPDAGHDQTGERWVATTADRLTAYINAAAADDQMLIGAIGKLEILNWPHPQETFRCAATLGDEGTKTGATFLQTRALQIDDLIAPHPAVIPQIRMPLVLENSGWTFHQLQADWISFRPDVAATLAWTAGASPGSWFTASGKPAVESVSWVDGWWGRNARAFDDTASEGHAVILHKAGFEEITSKLGQFSVHYEVERWAHEDGAETEHSFEKRSVQASLGP